MHRRWGILVVAAACGLGAAAAVAAPVEEHDGIMGEYAGTFTPARGGAVKAEARVAGLGDGKYRVLVTAGEGGKALRLDLEGQAQGKKVALDRSVDGVDWKVALTGGSTLVGQSGAGRLALRFKESKSPTAGAKPPPGALVLLPFAPGKPTSLDEWTHDSWQTLPDGSIVKGKGDIRTKAKLGSVRLHIEFLCPYIPKERDQGRGNSGVYLMDRYEVQVLDTFGEDKPRDNGCGGIYKVAVPAVNASLPPLSWQTYDMEFHAPVFDAQGRKKGNARVSVMLNGVKIHENVEIPGPTGGAAGGAEVAEAPLRFQDHGNPVRFRNIWAVPLKD